jgi:hypothetical protein
MNEYIIIAAVGGLTYNVVPLLELSRSPKESRPDFKDPLYWVPYLIWPVLAGFLLYLYQSPEIKITKLLSFHIGISAPLIIRQMIKVLPVEPETINLTDQDQ